MPYKLTGVSERGAAAVLAAADGWGAMGRHRRVRRLGGSNQRREVNFWPGLQPGFSLDGEDAQRAPAHGTIGPAKRAPICVGGACWQPNRWGLCMVCGGEPPRSREGGR